MLRLIMICATIVLACALVGSYLGGSDSPVQSIEANDGTHVLKASAAPGEAKVEDAEETDQAGDEVADDGESADENESADDTDAGGYGNSGNPPPSTDPWNPGQLPGEPGK